MDVNLICSQNLNNILTELLRARNISLDSDSDFVIVESGFEIPKSKISIVFDASRLGKLVELLDRMSGVTDETNGVIIGKVNEKYEVISLERICYFEARGNNIFCVTVDNQYRVRDKLFELEASLPQNNFIRVNKSFIVNIINVKEIVPWFGRRLLLRFNGMKTEVEVSKSYSKSFKDFLGM